MSEKAQSYANHRRFVPLYHYLLSVMLLVNLAWAGWRLYRHPGAATGFNLSLAIGLILLFYYARGFALAVQDRLIRLEERLRMREVLPEELHGRIGELSTDALIGLRFASDGELADLTREVLAGNLAGREQIKKRITDWRADNERC